MCKYIGSLLLGNPAYPFSLSIPWVNFTNILHAAFAPPVGLRQSLCRSWAYFLVGRNGKVGRGFVGETQQS